MPEIAVKDKLITLEELGTAYNNITPANIGAVATSAVIDISHGGTEVTGASGSKNELTAGQNITNYNSIVRKWGKFGVLGLFFEVTTQINAYATIFTATSDYKADTEYNAIVSDLSGKCYPVYYTAGGILIARVAMPAGRYYGNLSFCVL